MMNSITITWEISGDNKLEAVYFVNGSRAGEGDRGFENVLETIRANKESDVIIKFSTIHSFGGERLMNTLPFKNRAADLEKALSGRKVIYEFF
jgi:hypothetical protein